MRTQKEILTRLSNRKQKLFSNYPIKSMAIFGSYARNEQKPESDVDILVEFNENIGIRFIDFADELEEILGFKVDVVSRKGIKDKYFKAIQSDLIYV
jgi:hypothetical protein